MKGDREAEVEAEVEGARSAGLLVVYDHITVDRREAHNGQVYFDCVSIPLLKF